MRKIYKAIIIAFIATTAIAVFTACGEEPHEHTYARRWTSDETHHWHAATCGHSSERSEVGEHEFTTVDENTFCTVCGYGCAHEYEETVVPATCTADGYTEYSCGKCGTSYTDHVTKATGHDYQYTVIIQPDFQNGGTVSAVCTYDQSHTRTIEIPALNASDYSVTHQKAAGCETDGRDNYRYKLENGKYVTVPVTIPATGHSEGEGGICTVCGNNVYYKIASSGTTCTLTSYTGPETHELIIPATINGKTVTGIGTQAFAECMWLESVTLPETVIKIDAYAFGYCLRLEQLRILRTGNVDADQTAFLGCTSLQTISVPDSVIRRIPKDNLTEVTVTSGTNIYASAFEGCRTLERVILPESLTTIHNYAFADCYNLRSVTLPANVAKIDENAFLNCFKLVEVTNLSRIAIGPDSATDGKIGRYAKFILSEGDASVFRETDDGFLYFEDDGRKYLFHYNGSEANLVLPDGIEGGDYAVYPYAFYGQNNIISLTVPESVLEIGENAFFACYRMVEIYNYSRLDIRKDSENGCAGYYSYAIHTENAPSAVSRIGDFEFVYDVYAEEYRLLQYVGNEEQIVLPDTYKGQPYRIGAYCFHERTDLTRITVPDTVLSIVSHAFEHCSAEIVFLGTPSFRTIGEYAFYGYAGSRIDVPASVTSVGEYAFAECYNLHTISLPLRLTRVSATAFYNSTELQTVYYAGMVADWCEIQFESLETEEGVTSYANPMRYAERFFMNGSNPVELTSLTVPDGVTRLGDWQFMGFGRVTSVLLHTGVTEIGTGAFYGCDGITEIYLPKNAVLGSGVLAGCTSLQTIRLASGNTVVTGSNGFVYRYPIGYLFGTEEFNGTYVARQFYQDKYDTGVEALNEADFCIPLSLTTVEITDAQQPLSEFMFYNCSSIVCVILPQNLERIGSYTFMNCTALTTISLPQTLTEIGEGAFYNCASLTEIVLPASLESILPNAFALDSETDRIALLTVRYGGTSAQWQILLNGTNENKIFSQYNEVIKADS